MFNNIDIELYKDNDLVKKTTNIQVTKLNDKNAFMFEDEVLTKLDYNDNYLELIRESDEYQFSLRIGVSPNCSYILKNEDMVFNIKCDYSTYKITDRTIEITYKIETDDKENKVIILKNK